MAAMNIKTKIQKLRARIGKFTEEIEALQKECNHPNFEQGLSMIACIQPIWICTECGHAKPLTGPYWYHTND